MAITGIESRYKDMRLDVRELKVNGVAFAPAAQATAIADLTVTGTYATDDDNIKAKIDGILAVLRANGFIAT